MNWNKVKNSISTKFISYETKEVQKFKRFFFSNSLLSLSWWITFWWISNFSLKKSDILNSFIEFVFLLDSFVIRVSCQVRNTARKHREKKDRYSWSQLPLQKSKKSGKIESYKRNVFKGTFFNRRNKDRLLNLDWNEFWLKYKWTLTLHPRMC